MQELIYAEIGPNTTSDGQKSKFSSATQDDDKVEYAELRSQQFNDSTKHTKPHDIGEMCLTYISRT